MTGVSDDWKYKKNPNIICLFDIDGTLTPARKVGSLLEGVCLIWNIQQTISAEMRDTLRKLREKVVVGFVGGSDLPKQIEQIGEDGE